MANEPEIARLVAAATGDQAALARFVEGGGDVDAPHGDYTLLSKALEGGQRGLAAWLLSRGANPEGGNAMPNAGYAGDVAALKMLVEAGAHIDCQHTSSSWEGRTALSNAAAAGRADAVRWLISHGARVDVRSAGGYTPLLFSESVEIATLLLNAGACVDAFMSDGDTALMRAAAIGNTELVALLLQRGADVNARGLGGPPPGTSALAYAAENDQIEIVEMLVAAGVDLVAEHAHYEAATTCRLTELADSDRMAELISLPA